MKRLWLILFVIIGCSKEKEYDYSRIKIAPKEYHDILKVEMFDGNKLGDVILEVESLHHKNVTYIGGMVFGEGIEGGYPCVWSRNTGGIVWSSLNEFSKYLPKNDNVSIGDCCARAVKKMTKAYYERNK